MSGQKNRLCVTVNSLFLLLPQTMAAFCLGTVQVTGTIGSNDFYASKTIAEEFWKLYTEQETSEIVH